MNKAGFYQFRIWRMLALLCACVASIASASRSQGGEPIPQSVEFNRDIRPIFSDNCFACHGPDEAKRRSKLRLDTEAGAFVDLEGRRAIVPGNPQQSEIYRRVSSQDETERMPHISSGRKLTERQIELIRRWIEQGARWQKHWSLIPPQRPPLPKVSNTRWPRNPIDFFILERLERERFSPSPEADKTTLIRRVTLDLTGLPPTPAEVDAFLADKSRGAYEKVVDRLLASPRYGERMAARWLDAARYADTNGYQYDGERVMWRWRDWVIDAFNRNQPFNQFIIQQIAGDMLPNATREQKIATGFNRNHRGNTEDGIVPEEYAVEYVVDRVETTSTVFLGLTLGCARCHHHKYDPFTQKEFYQLYAYFDNVPERGRAMKYGNSPPLVAAPTREQQLKQLDLERQITATHSMLRRSNVKIEKAQKTWERQFAGGEPAYWAPHRALEASFPFEDTVGLKEVGGKVAPQPGRIGKSAAFDGTAYLDAGNIAVFDIGDPFTISAWVYSDSIPDGSIVSKMADSPKGKGYGLHLNKGKVYVHLTSDWTTDAIRLETEESLVPGRWHHLAVTYTGSRMAEGVRVYINGKTAPVQIQLDTLYRPFRNAGREFKDPLRIGGGAGPERRFRGQMDEVRIYSRTLPEQEIAALALGEPLSAIAVKAASDRSEGEKLALRWYFLENAAPPKIRSAWNRLAALEQQEELLERSFPTVMVMAENATRKNTFLLIRGAYDKPGEKVEPRIPAVLPQLPAGEPNNRLGFARWLVDPANPLPARVAVNRFWQMFFGAGLVKSTEDFGVQGEPPSHPELLDWLATEFVRSGWDVKALQKLIVTSATYRQSSKTTLEFAQRDDENRLLGRGPRFRLPAEMIRDQALFVSGLLAEKLGGPSVKPYQPEGLWKEISMQDMEYKQSQGRDLYRRSLYTFWKRTIAPPMMVNFDAAPRESCVVREMRTNTPLQALNLMNDVTFVEAARFLGQRMMKEGGAERDSRLRYGFRLVTGRLPSAGEAGILRKSLEYHVDYFSRTPGAAGAYLQHGESSSDGALDPREVAAYAAVASLMLNLDETVTKE
ncbi:MAG TPA: DUF1553 domain-containing protein [Acidobacteriota bacterium]|jgi:hypothetical protein